MENAPPSTQHESSRTLIIAAFAAVYIIWGSTYLAIRYVVESAPPWTFASLRFVAASLIMFTLAWLRREQRLTRREMRFAALTGCCLIAANGAIGVVEQWIASGAVAVVIGATPIWIMIFGTLFFGFPKPSMQKILGALIGLSGIILIAGDTSDPNLSSHLGQGLTLLFASNLLWVVGTLLQKKLGSVRSSFLFTGWQMLFGSLVTISASFIFESPWNFAWASVSTQSWYALTYLIVFGSVIGFTAYSWLSRQVEPHLVSTYALVNPIIAVFLGWWIGEHVSPQLTSATALVVIGISLLLFQIPKKRLVTLAPK